MKKVLWVCFLLFASMAQSADFQKGFKAYNQQDYKTAYKEWLPLAEQGDATAQYNLGVMYKNGSGVKKDAAQAVAWYRKAAEQGDATAQSNLGVMYGNGSGVKKDAAQAVAWYRKAAEQGDALAQSNLGVMYENGSGVKKDAAQAVAWYRKAAEQGVALAQYNLGVMYGNGSGVKKDAAQAVAWYRKAAEQGYATAQSNLGVMYSNGSGVKKDAAQAVAWYRKAAEQGYATAQSNLGWMYENGSGVKKDLQKALLLYKKSGSDWAMNKYHSLNKRLNCQSLAKTKLFGVPLICANRDDLWLAIKKTKAQVKREDKRKWGDIYLTSNVLKGSSELAIDYTVDDFFAKATYTFPSRMNTTQVSEIKNFVANKYGPPNYENGRVSLGNVTYKWDLEDGIELIVSRGWPNTTTYLSYTYPENYLAMTKEQDRQKKEREAKEYQAQGDAF